MLRDFPDLWIEAEPIKLVNHLLYMVYIGKPFGVVLPVSADLPNIVVEMLETIAGEVKEMGSAHLLQI